MTSKYFIFLVFLIANLAFGQSNKFDRFIETSDINNFWKAFDEVHKSNDSLSKSKIFQDIYVDHASKGLIDFIDSRGFTSEAWIKSFYKYPKFWNSIRLKTESLNNDFNRIERVYKRFNRLYDDFVPPKIYFTIGNLKGGGTVINGNLIIGSELAASDKFVDFSELPENYQKRMKINSGIIFLTTHELVHTQQNLNDSRKITLLGLSLKEGSADFLAELILRKKVEAPYIEYGLNNQCNIWQQFQKEMNGHEYQNWLSNTATIKNKPADLGYFIGYIISKNYYNNSKNKKQAVKDMLELDFNDNAAIENFLKKSNYKCKK